MRYALGTIALVAAAILAAPVDVAPLQAQTPQLQGTFTYDAAASDNINQAIERAVARMNFVTRPIARGRLRRTNEAYERIRISYTPAQVSVVTDARAPIVTPASGSAIRWTREDGEVLDVSTTWESGALTQTFKAEDGQRVNRYSVGPDGSVLTMQVTITSPRLAAPLVYNLRYRRAE